MRRLCAVLFTVSVMLVGCGGSSGTASGGGSAATTNGGGGGGAAADTITISNFDYGDPLTVAPGATVTVVNQDSAEHSVTDKAGSFDTGLFSGEMTFTAPNEAGTYDIICTAHPQMAGQLIVSG